MPKSQKSRNNKSKVYAVPTAAAKRKDGGSVPKIQTAKLVGRQAMPYGKSKALDVRETSAPNSMAALLVASNQPHEESEAGPSSIMYQPVDTSLTRDSSSKAFMRELRKVIERSDVIIQVLDARDPEGTRSRWVEEEVRKRESQGKKLLGVVNKIDLVPRANLEAWLKHLRHSFPCMPFKSSTQAQRQNLSQNAVPLAPTSNTPGQAQTLQALPTTSSSLGAPALLHLLKQYALSTPHSSLTVGVVGYPNVGKSSLINSLKRSRACAVAAMPGKTRVTQEVVLDKGVKIVDCPGVVLEDVTKDMGGDQGRRKAAEMMLRNCIKAELVEDPVAPVEVILSKVDPALLQKQYNIPPYADVREFLIRIALTRGRLGKGGVPDLQGSAVSVLRDWNSGKIPYFTSPPTIHPSSAPTAQASAVDAGDVEMEGEQVGSAKILNTLSEAFSLDGLFDTMGDGAAWEGELAADGEAMLEDQPLDEAVAIPPAVVPAQPFPALPKFAFSDDEDDEDEDAPRFGVRPLPVAATPDAPPLSSAPTLTRRGPATNLAKMFTPDELALLPTGMLDRQKQKQLAKKAKKKRAAAGLTEAELMAGFVTMDVEEPVGDEMEEDTPRLSKKQLAKEKMRKKKLAQKVIERPTDAEMDAEARKVADFASFLNTVGADDDMDEEL